MTTFYRGWKLWNVTVCGKTKYFAELNGVKLTSHSYKTLEGMIDEAELNCYAASEFQELTSDMITWGI